MPHKTFRSRGSHGFLALFGLASSVITVVMGSETHYIQRLSFSNPSAEGKPAGETGISLDFAKQGNMLDLESGK